MKILLLGHKSWNKLFFVHSKNILKMKSELSKSISISSIETRLKTESVTIAEEQIRLDFESSDFTFINFVDVRRIIYFNLMKLYEPWAFNRNFTVYQNLNGAVVQNRTDLFFWIKMHVNKLLIIFHFCSVCRRHVKSLILICGTFWIMLTLRTELQVKLRRAWGICPKSIDLAECSFAPKRCRCQICPQLSWKKLKTLINLKVS